MPDDTAPADPAVPEPAMPTDSGVPVPTGSAADAADPVAPEPEPTTAPEPDGIDTDDHIENDGIDNTGVDSGGVRAAAALEPARPDASEPRGGVMLPAVGWPLSPIDPGALGPWPSDLDDLDPLASPWAATRTPPAPQPSTTAMAGGFAARVAAGEPCPGMPVALLDAPDSVAFVDPEACDYAPILLRSDFVVTAPDFTDLTHPATLGGAAYLAAGRTRPGTVLPTPDTAPAPIPPDTGPFATPYERLCLYVTMTGAPGPDDGHGGHTNPPPGALRYKPSARLATLVRATWPTCVFPYCNVPAAKCELDHRVAYDHDDPDQGGWTILENLAPLCKNDHDIKSHGHWTCRPVPGGLVWTNGTGLMFVVTPTSTRAYGVPNTPAPEPAPRLLPADPELSEQDNETLLYEPTWWETHMGENTPPPPPHDTELRARYREHRAITTLRERRYHDSLPPPF